jgi:hypothetical protein
MFYKVISMIAKMRRRIWPAARSTPLNTLAITGEHLHEDARALATEAALVASADAGLAALVGVWQHDHEVHDTERSTPKGLRHS